MNALNKFKSPFKKQNNEYEMLTIDKSKTIQVICNYLILDN